METYQGKIKFNDTATNPGKNTKRFFGQIEMLDSEGDTNSYAMVSFRSQVISQSENLGKNGMSGKTAKVKGTFELNSYGGKEQWQLKIDELYIEGMENLAETIKSDTTIQLPKKPSDVTIPTDPTAPLVENIPQNSIQNAGVMPMPGSAQGGFVYNPATNAGPSAAPTGGPGPASAGGFVYNQSANNTSNALPTAPAIQAIPGGPSPVPTAPPASIPSSCSQGGYVYNQTNLPTSKVEKPINELHKYNNIDLPDAF